ncbi:hypothetical protein Hanom_Chr03g00275491 [Helianthus anomalus]
MWSCTLCLKKRKGAQREIERSETRIRGTTRRQQRWLMVSIRGSATCVGGDGGIGGDLGILGVDLAAAVTQPATTTNFCGVILK